MTEILPKPIDDLFMVQSKKADEEEQINRKALVLTVEQAIALHIEEIHNLNTSRAKALDLKQFKEFLLNNNVVTLGQLASLSNLRLEKYCQAFLESRLNIGNSPSSVQRKKSSIINFFAYLQFYFNQLYNYIPKIKNDKFRVNRSKGVTESLSYEEWFKLKEQIRLSKNKELLPLVCFAILAGGRRISECRDVLWSDIEFRNNRIKIRPLKRKRDDFEYQPLEEGLKSILKAFFELKGNPNINDRVFNTKQQSVDKSLKYYANKAGIRKTVSFHSLRASFITWGLERGDSLSELLNATLHSSPNMLRYYDRTETLKTNSIFKTKI